MSNDPGKDQLDGISTGDSVLKTSTGQQIIVHDGQVLPWRPVTHYRVVKDSGDRNVTRNSGSYGRAGLGGPLAGNAWDTPSTLDAMTVLSEIYTVVYQTPDGKNLTGMDILIELYKGMKGIK
jgi:hypothetical protein